MTPEEYTKVSPITEVYHVMDKKRKSVLKEVVLVIFIFGILLTTAGAYYSVFVSMFEMTTIINNEIAKGKSLTATKDKTIK